MKQIYTLAVLAAVLGLVGCGAPQKEMTSEEIAFQKKLGSNTLLAKTVNQPGSATPYAKGQTGGVWQAAINNDPKTFNTLTARDGDSRDVVDLLYDGLVDYDFYKREWKPNLASWEIKADQKSGSMELLFTLRDDIFWTSLAEPDKKVKVTSDDLVFWYNEIEGDPALQQPGYAQQFQKMPNGSQRRIEIEKIDDRRFKFKYPRIVAMPELSSNMQFGPKYVFEAAKKSKGVEGVLNLWSIDTDPRTIPSIGQYYIAGYKPGIGVTMKRNPHYWKKDDYGQSLPYIDTVELKVIPNRETEKLKFEAGDTDSYILRPEDLQNMVEKKSADHTIYYGGPSLGAAFITWNQNPKNLSPKLFAWFSQQKFRQAMSCFFNRERVIAQVYRGLAEPAVYFFSKANPYFDPAIKQQFLYDPARGAKLLAEIGIKPDAQGIMRDSAGNAIEFDLNMGIENNIGIDIGNIYADDLKKAGIKLNIKPLDFQKLVDKLITTYDWHAALVSLGSNNFPSQGSNVWQSKGNFHFWRPLQKAPATEWEAKVDTLYQEADTTLDKVAAKKIWDEYQRLILDQVPLMYTVLPDGFTAIRNKWANVRVDNLGAPDRSYIYLK